MTAEELLVAFTARCWDYDTISCAICDGSNNWDDSPSTDPHDDFVFDHKPDCLWVEAHRIIGRDLGPHKVDA